MYALGAGTAIKDYSYSRTNRTSLEGRMAPVAQINCTKQGREEFCLICSGGMGQCMANWELEKRFMDIKAPMANGGLFGNPDTTQDKR